MLASPLFPPIQSLCNHSCPFKLAHIITQFSVASRAVEDALNSIISVIYEHIEHQEAQYQFLWDCIYDRLPV